MPVRGEFSTLGRDVARRNLGLGSGESVLLVFGGSRGASALNLAMSEILPRLSKVTVIWATGEADYESLRAAMGDHSGRHRIVPYLNNMPEAMVAADLAVTRAGAMTLAELAIAGVPAILVPYPYAMNDHQAANARNWDSAGAGIVIADSDLRSRLHAAVGGLLESRTELSRMSAAARRLGRVGVAAEIADALEMSVG
jgi:UDP-N-acetylglucosamine--N-acetylmuramyl-(pentapeptide) pyrophosphoryl-undecaprenol N-acetylglucosamine transferase